MTGVRVENHVLRGLPARRVVEVADVEGAEQVVQVVAVDYTHPDLDAAARTYAVLRGLTVVTA